MRTHLAAFLLAAVALQPFGLARAADYDGPVHRHRSGGPRAAIGDCMRTRVDLIGAPPGTSTPPVIRYRDGVVQDYDSGMLGQQETRAGDPIRLCLVSFTRDCGTVFADEQPGRTYATGNLRTGAAWTSPDIRSRCVGR